jgi:U5 snRNP spliceosome subunit
VQQLLLENAAVGSGASAGNNGGPRVLGHLDYPHLARGRMTIEGYTPGVPSLPPPPTLHHHPPQPHPPYYYANYVPPQQQQQHPTPSVEDLFSLWLGSTSAGIYVILKK